MRQLIVWVAMALVGCAASTSSGGSPAGTPDAGVGATGSGGSVGSGTGGANSSSGGANATGGGAASPGTGGSSAGSGGAAAGSGGSGVGQCITWVSVSPDTLDNLTAGSDARVRLHAAVAPSARPPVKWTWTVLLLPDVSVPITLTDDPSTIEFPIAIAGRYQVVVDTGVIGCAAARSLIVGEPERNVLTFAIAPPDSFREIIPNQRLKVAVKAPNTSSIVLALQGGTLFRILPQQAGGATMSSFVRVRALSGASSVDGYTDRGPVPAVLLPWPIETYEVLIIPDGFVAPQLFGTSDLRPTIDHLVPLTLSSGIDVTGAATDASNRPVPDTRVVLRSGTRPSTVGSSDASGGFALRTRSGVHSVVFSPPFDSGLPEARLSAAPGITIADTDTTVAMQLKWAAFSMVAVDLRIKSADGASDVIGASVWLESQSDFSNVGTVSLTSSPGAAPTTLSASGMVRVAATSDGTGMARFAAVPAGMYTVSILPPTGSSAPSSSATLTRAVLAAVAGGVARSISTSAPVVLAGRLLPVGQTAGMQVLARDQSLGVTAPTASALVDSAGRYQLSVAPGRTYQLEADPAGLAGFARAVLGNVDVGAQGGPAQAVPDFAAAPGTTVSGIVKGTSPSGQPSVIGGALVQVFCPGPSLTCPAPDRAVAETVSRPDGTFQLVLPTTLVE